MTRATPEWIGKNDDTAIPPRVRALIAEAFHGRCAECTRKLEPGKWQCDHIVALINGGQHRQSNLQPLCTEPCHKAKTKTDVAIKAKSARVRQKHLGIARPRTIRSWRRFDGSIVHATRERT